jgi:tRNA A-37 threonylcarbamoyl transferase component Bud32
MEPRVFAWLSELTRRNALLAILVVLVASVAAAWSFLNVQQAVKHSRATLLSSLLATQSEAILIWAEERRADTTQWARDPSIIAVTGKLLDRHRVGGIASGDNPKEAAMFLDRIAPAIEDLRLAAANIAAPDGTLIASLVPELVGATLSPEYLARIKPAFDGGSVFVGPTLEQDRLPGMTAERRMLSVIWTAAPVKSREGKVLAVLSLGRYATRRFARTLEVTRPGETGEAYAFNSKGMLLSPSRFESRLKESGLMDDGGTFSPGAMSLREYLPVVGPSPHMPLTALVGQAIAKVKSSPAEFKGTMLQPYLNYVGTPVIGAWQWLPSLDLGIAIEMAEAEAYAPIAFLNTNLLILLLTLAFAVFVGPLLPPLLWRRFVPITEGDRIGSYRLSRKIGEGGLADVYEGVHEGLEKPVAVKIMKGQLREELEVRFEREARLLALLNHPRIVSVFDADHCEDGRPYYVMELVEGLPLGRLVEDGGPLAERLACEILEQVCDAVQYMHDRGITHRDLKPENILVQEAADGAPQIKLIDFGFAKSLTEKDRMHLTQDMSLMGTLGYMAPERIKDPEDTDIRGDVYAVGAIGYFLMTGKELIPDIGNLDDLNGHPIPAPGSIRNDMLAGIVVKAMSIRKSERWSSCAHLAEALGSVSGGTADR